MTIEINRQSVGELVQGLDQVVVIGDQTVICGDALPLRDAKPGCITLIDAPARAAIAIHAGAVAIVTGEPIESLACTQIVAKDIHAVFTHIVSRFRPRSETPAYASIHSSAQIDPTAVIGGGTRIDAGVVVGAHAVIGDDCHLMPGCVVMEHATIGNHCRVFPNVVIYEHTRIDSHVRIHAGSVIGADGFGYRQIEGRHVSTAQLGYVHIESHVDIGANVTIDRGTYGVTRIGEGTKIDNLVMIAHNCHIGRHNLLCSQVGIAGSCKTGDYVVLAGQVGLADHVSLGDHAIVGAQAGVMENLAGDQVYLGSPATSQRDQMQIMAVQRRLPDMRREVKTLRRELDAVQKAQAQRMEMPASAIDPQADAEPETRPADDHGETHQRCIPFRRPAA